MSVYSSRQVHCMRAIGLVPWVRRASGEQVVAQAITAQTTTTTTHTAPVDAVQVNAVQAATVHLELQGNLDAKLMLIFPSWPLDRADDALLDGMLRAIGLSKSEVCTSVVKVRADLASAIVEPPRSHFLYFGSSDIPDTATEPMSIGLGDGQLVGWQLPSLATLRDQPLRKRQAWITLKHLRSVLDQH